VREELTLVGAFFEGTTLIYYKTNSIIQKIKKIKNAFKYNKFST
jgi:hypothetical protein